VSGSEIAVVILAALVLFGGKRLPEMARTWGRMLRDLRRSWNEMKREMGLDAIDDIKNMKDGKKE